MLKIDEGDRPTSVAQVREALRGKAIPEAGRQPDSQIPNQAQVPATTRAPSRRGRAAAIAITLLILAGLAGVGSYAFYANYQAKRQAIQQSDLEAKQQAKQQADLLAKQQAERQVQAANARQQLLADQLASAGTDQSKLGQFLSACGSDCPDAFRTQAQARIDTIKQQRQAELTRQDEATYRAARGDLTKLRAYDTSCIVCTFRDVARSEIASIEDQQRKLASQETVSRGWIGVQIQPVTPDIAHSLGLKKAEGALVTEPQANGPAAQAGIVSGDVITALNGETVKDAREFVRVISRLVPGSAAKLGVFHNGQNKDVYLTLGQLPNSSEAKVVIDHNVKGSATSGIEVPPLGLTLAPTNGIADYAGTQGVVVTKVDPNSAAAQRGFKEGDVIVEIAGRSVARAEDVRDAINAARADNKSSVLIRVKSGASSRFVAVPWAKG
jgi:C-terminal processing protease CtpA/Prc